MRNFVSLFIHASVERGEWIAALQALQVHCMALPPTSTTTSAPTATDAVDGHDVLVQCLSRIGQWKAAISILSQLQQQIGPCDSSNQRLVSYLGVMQSYWRGEGNKRLPPTPSEDNAVAEATAKVSMARTLLQWAGMAVGSISSPASAPASVGTDDLRSIAQPHEQRHVIPTLNEECRTAIQDLYQWTTEKVTLLLSPQEMVLFDAELQHLKAAVQDYTAIPTQRTATLSAAESAASVLSSVREDRKVNSSIVCKTSSTLQLTEQQTRQSQEKQQQHNSTTASSVADSHLAQLEDLINRPKACRSWIQSLQLFNSYMHSSSLPSPSSSSLAFTLVLRNLARHGRRREAEQFFCHHFDPQMSTIKKNTSLPIWAEKLPLKVVAESALVLRSTTIALAVLEDLRLRRFLTPSAAVPLIMTLHQQLRRHQIGGSCNHWKQVLHWWEEVKNCEGNTHGRYPLAHHMKLSSYVASYVLAGMTHRSKWKSTASSCVEHRQQAVQCCSGKETNCVKTPWKVALDIFSTVRHHAPDPAMVLLYEVRLLRQVGAWQPAVQLLHDLQQRKQRSSSWCCQRDRSMEMVWSVLTEERAMQWIPSEVVLILNHQKLEQRTTPHL